MHLMMLFDRMNRIRQRNSTKREVRLVLVTAQSYFIVLDTNLASYALAEKAVLECVMTSVGEKMDKPT